MNKEKQLPPFQNPDAVRETESSKYFFRNRANAFASGDHIAYEWLEDSVIRKMASVEFGRDETGKETATIKMINPKTKKEETVYYTTDETQVVALKGISEGRILEVEISEKNPKNEIKELD